MSGTQIANSQRHTQWTKVDAGAAKLTQDTSRDDATNALVEVAAKLKDKGGKLAIWNSNSDKKSGSQEAKFVRKWFVGSQRKERTAEVVKNLFEKSSSRLNSESERQAFMHEVTTYLDGGRKAIKGDTLHGLVHTLDRMVTNQEQASPPLLRQAQEQIQPPRLLSVPAPLQAEVEVKVEAQVAAAELAPVSPPVSAPVNGRMSVAMSEHLSVVLSEDPHVSSYMQNEPVGLDVPDHFEQELQGNAFYENAYNEVSSRPQSVQNDSGFDQVYDDDADEPQFNGARKSADSQRSSNEIGQSQDQQYIDQDPDFDPDDWDKKMDEKKLLHLGSVDLDDDDDAIIRARVGSGLDKAALLRAQQQQQAEQNKALISDFEHDFLEHAQSIYSLNNRIQAFERNIQSKIQRVNDANNYFDNTPETQRELDRAHQDLAVFQSSLNQLLTEIEENVNAINDLASGLDSEEWQGISENADKFKLSIDTAREDLKAQASAVEGMLGKLNIERPDMNKVMNDLNKISDSYLKNEIEPEFHSAYQHLHTNRLDTVLAEQDRAIAVRDNGALKKANDAAEDLLYGNGESPSLNDLSHKIQEAKAKLNENVQWLRDRGFEASSQAMQSTQKLMAAFQNLEGRVVQFAQRAQHRYMPEIAEQATTQTMSMDEDLARLLDTPLPALQDGNSQEKFYSLQLIHDRLNRAVDSALELPSSHPQRDRVLGRLSPNGRWFNALEGLQQFQYAARAEIQQLIEAAGFFTQEQQIAWQREGEELQDKLAQAQQSLVELERSYHKSEIGAQKTEIMTNIDATQKQIAQTQSDLTQHGNGPIEANRTDQRTIERLLAQVQEMQTNMEEKIQLLKAA